MEKKNIHYIIILVIIILIIIFGLNYYISKTAEESDQDINKSQGENMDQVIKGEKKEDIDKEPDQDNEIDDMTFQYSGNLSDVSSGNTIRNITTNGNARGFAQADFDGDTYNLKVKFENLPDPNGSDFYEGWVVRQNPLSVISTGKVEIVNGIYTNSFSSNQDLTDHSLYALTLEPDDNNPEPADHILEGTMFENTITEKDNTEIVQETLTFEIDGTNFAFSIKEIKVKKGDTIKIVFSSKEGFHDWVVDEFDVATEKITTGNTTEVEFVADQKGEFEYYCSVGNHRQLGMVGKLIVE